MNYEARNIRYKIEEKEEWLKWREEIPYLQFNPEWSVKVIPPFAGAIVRFLVQYRGNNCSVYLDCYQCLGMNDGPYWEVYPVDGDVARCAMHDTSALMQFISQALARSRP